MALDHWSREFFGSTRGQVALVLRRGPATVEEVAGSLGLTGNAVRSHLQTLTRDGFVRPAGVRRGDGAGKPATLYELAPEAEPLFSQAYLPVLRAVLAAVAAGLPPRKREDLIREAARQLAGDPAVASIASVPNGVERAARLLEGLGGLVEIVPEHGQAVLQGSGCPLSALAAEHPEICHLVEVLLTEVVGADVREECRRGERPQCRFVLSPHTGSPAGAGDT